MKLIYSLFALVIGTFLLLLSGCNQQPQVASVIDVVSDTKGFDKKKIIVKCTLRSASSDTIVCFDPQYPRQFIFMVSQSVNDKQVLKKTLQSCSSPFFEENLTWCSGVTVTGTFDGAYGDAYLKQIDIQKE